MVRIRWAGWLLGACLLSPAFCRGQTVEQRESETLERSGKAAAVQGKQPDLARAASLIVELANAFRRHKGLHELKVNPDLAKDARSFAEYLARTDKFSHSADGRQPSERAVASGYAYCIIAENIAWEYDSAGFTTGELARALLKGWKNSPGHRRNLLDPDVTDTGAAVARSDRTGRYYAVQEFGRPRSAAIVFRVSNETDQVARYTVDGKLYTLPPATTRIHELCRPADLDFEGAGDTAAPEDASVFHPAPGARFVIRGDGAGGYRMTQGT
jgi:uncharacterized protein YkwD